MFGIVSTLTTAIAVLASTASIIAGGVVPYAAGGPEPWVITPVTTMEIAVDQVGSQVGMTFARVWTPGHGLQIP